VPKKTKQPKSAHGKKDETEIEVRRRLHGHIGGEHHTRFALQYRDGGDQRSYQHQNIAQPRNAWRRQAAVEDHRRGEVENRHLEKDDPEQEYRRAMSREDQVEEIGRQDMHGRPSG
jgi:hypothetical protein